ncbi:MAG: ABC transporter ATP-binding protein [Acidobacteriota bacterium]
MSHRPTPAPLKKRSGSPLLQLEGLILEARGAGRLVDELDLEIHAGEILGLVGDSGSGKTLSSLAIMGLLPPGIRVAGGSLRIDSATAALGARSARSRGARRRVSMIFQEPRSALNPLFSVGFQIAEALRLEGLRGRALRSRGLELLDLVALADPELRWRAYPHQLSGGECQRVMLAMALASEPSLLIADEPTTALDVSVQARVLALIERLRRELSLGILLITHDLAVVAAICDRLAVMEQGRKVEEGSVAEIFESLPKEAATRRLLEAGRSQSAGRSTP